jgi:thioredoxin 1
MIYARLTISLLSLALFLVFDFLPSRADALAKESRIEMASIFARKVPVMLQFGKSWCPRCRSTKPILDSVARSYEGKALVVPVDVEVNMDLVREFRIRLIPTQIFLRPDRTEFFRHEGVLLEPQIREVLEEMAIP